MMKRFLLMTLIFCLAAAGISAQVSPLDSGMISFDAAVRRLAADLSVKLLEERAGKVALGEFSYNGVIPPLGLYWANQLCEELANRNASFSVLSGGSQGAEWLISGEIVELVNTIRVYTRLQRADTRAIRAAFHSEFERNDLIIGMLSAGDGSRAVPRDAWEPDSMDNPVICEVGPNGNAATMNRTIHNGSDEDFFLLQLGNYTLRENERLIIETTGSLDTYMELYDADTREKLAQNDDGGSGNNARIRFSPAAGKRYIVKVRGYDGGDTGPYGLDVHYKTQAGLPPDEFEPDNDSSSARTISIGTPQRHTFHDEDDVDWVKFEILQRARYSIRTGGVNSNNLDTYIELFDEDMNSIAEDDDGGEGYSSYLSRILMPGIYYLKVGSYLDDEKNEPYTILISKE